MSAPAADNEDPRPPQVDPADPGSRCGSGPGSDEDLSLTHLSIFWIGLVVYGTGFGLLAAGWTQLAPVALVGGLMAMVAAFLV